MYLCVMCYGGSAVVATATFALTGIRFKTLITIYFTDCEIYMRITYYYIM